MKKVSRSVAIFMAISVIGKIMGLIRDRQQAIHFGAHTAESIAFHQASMLPRTMFDIMFSAAFTASLIPVFVTYLEQKGKEAAYNLAALFMFVLALFTIITAAAGFLFAGPIFRASVGDGALPYGTVELGTRLLRMMFPIMVFTGFAFSFAGVLQALGEFRITAAMSVVSNGFILVYYFFFIERFGVYGLAVSFMVGFFAQAVIQVPFLLKHKFRFRLCWFDNPSYSGCKQILRLTIPAMAATWVLPLNVLVNARAAAPLYGGQFGLNAIYFAHTIFTITSGVFILAVSNVIFPKLSRHAAASDSQGFQDTLAFTVRSLLFALIPLTFFLFVFGEGLVAFVFGGGLFGGQAIKITARALSFFSLGIVGYGLMLILSRACFAKQDKKTPLVAAVLAIVVNGVLSFTLAPVMLVAGPALANTLGSTVGAAYLFIVLHKQGVFVQKWLAFKDYLKMFIAALMAFVPAIVLGLHLSDFNNLFQIIIPALIYGVLYFLLSLFLKLSEAKWILDVLLFYVRKLRRK